MPLVSVIIPAYNQGRYLGQAIRSVLEQSCHDLEVIVVDDGSTDDTPHVASGFRDARVHYIYQENRGLSGARNSGIRASRGKFLSFLDSDDVLLSRNVELLSGVLIDEPGIGLVAGQAIPVDEECEPKGKIFKRPLPVDETANLVLGNPVPVGSMMLRRSWQERVGFFDDDLRSYEDWDMWLRLARAGCRMGWLAEPVMLYRFHGAQMTKNANRMTTACFRVLEKIFEDSSLPDNWSRLRDPAYSNAHIRAAANYYLEENYEVAKVHLTKALDLDESLQASAAQPLVDKFLAWTELPKIQDPLTFLENIYHHLPDSLMHLRHRRRKEIGRVAMKMVFEAYERGDHRTVRSVLWKALYFHPQWILNRGVLSIFFKTHLVSAH